MVDISSSRPVSFRVVLKVPKLSLIGDGCIVEEHADLPQDFDKPNGSDPILSLCIDSSGRIEIFAATGTGSVNRAGGISTDAGFTANVTHEMLWQYDGSHLIAFRDGIPVRKDALTGPLHTLKASGNGYFEMLNFPGGGGNETYPNSNNGSLGVAAIYDSYQVEKGAMVTVCPLTGSPPVVGMACYTPSTSKHVAVDANTLLLIAGNKRCTNIGQAGCSVDGTQYAQTGLKAVSPSGNVYIPVLTGNSPITPANSGSHIHDLELCDGTGGGSPTEAFMAIWSFQSEFDHLHCINNRGLAFDFFTNDWDSYVHDMSVFGGSLAYSFGGDHFGESSVERVTSDSTAVHEFLNGPGILQSYSQWAPRGAGVVGWIYENTKFNNRFSFMDAEENDPNQIGTMIINAPYGLMMFDSFENAETPNNVEPFVTWLGRGQTAQFSGAHAFYRGAPMVSYVTNRGSINKPGCSW